MEGVTRLCFGASYGVAFAAELLQAIWPRPALRSAGLVFGAAGLVAHSIYLVVQRPTFAAPYGSFLLIAWVLAVFYFYGTVHHRRLHWAVFVLPLVLGLVVAAGWFSPGASPEPWPDWVRHVSGPRFWGAFHGVLVLLGAVGVCVGAVASAMFLVQARRLQSKVSPSVGLRLMSLERLELMNRRAIAAAFPLLTAGLFVGAAVGLQRDGAGGPWLAPKVLTTAGLWLASGALLVLRYSLHARGRVLAVGTLATFAVLLATLATAHPFAGGGP